MNRKPKSPKTKVNKTKDLPKKTYIIRFTKDGKDGWAFGLPRGISKYQWPRSPASGIPMKILFTTRVPEEYNHSPYEYMSVFQADADEPSSKQVKIALSGKKKGYL